MLKKFKSLFTIKKISLAALASLLFYSLTLGLIVPYYIKGTVIPEQLAKFQLEASVKELSYNPFRQRLTINNFTAKHAGSEYIGFDKIVVNINLTQIILGKGIIFDAFELDHPRLYLERGPKGEINFVKILPKSEATKEVTSNEEKTGFILPTIEFDHFAVNKGSIKFKDLTNTKPFEFALNDLSFVLPQFSTKHSLENQPKLSLISDTGMILSWQGALQFNPLSSAGKITLEKLDLTPFAPYYEPWIHLDLASGRVGFEIDYQVDPLATKPEVNFTVQHFTLEDFLIREKDDQELVQSLPFFQIRQLKWDLLKPSFIIDEFEIKDGQIVIERDKEGQVNVLPPINKSAPATPVTLNKPQLATNKKSLSNPANTSLEKPYFSKDLIGAIQSLSWHLDKVWAQSWISAANDVYIHNYQITIEDDFVPEGMKLNINDISLRIKNLKNKRDEKASLDIKFKINEQEQSINALFSPIPLKGQISTELSQIPFEKFNSYIKSYSPYKLHKAMLSLKSKTDFNVILGDKPKTSLKTNIAFKINDFDLEEKIEKAGLSFSSFEFLSEMTIDKSSELNVVADNKLSLKGVKTQEDRKQIAFTLAEFQVSNKSQLKIDEHYHLHLNEQSSLSLNDLKLQEKKQGIKLDLATITIDNKSTLKENEKLSLKGELELKLEGLDANKNDKSLALKLKALALKSLKYDLDPLAVHISEILIDQAHASLKNEAVKQDKKAQASAEATSPKQEKQKALIDVFQIAELFPLNLKIDHIKVTDNKVAILDQNLFHDWFFTVDKINLDIKDFKSHGQNPVELKLSAEIEELGEFNMTSKLPFNKKEIDGFLKLSLEEFPLSSMSPFGVTSTHYPIKGGSLQFALDSTLTKNKLEGQLGAIINKTKLGKHEKADERAMNIPLKFGLALLQDSKGKIDFSGIDLHGDLSDPKFRLWFLVWRSLKTICIKAVTSPFNYFASLVGASEDELEDISFKDGKAKLSKSLEKQLRKVAKGLNKRPNLKLTLVEHGLNKKDLELLKLQKFNKAFDEFKKTKTVMPGHQLSELQSYYYTVFPKELPTLTALKNQTKTKQETTSSTKKVDRKVPTPIKAHKKPVWFLPWTWGNSSKDKEISAQSEIITEQKTVESPNEGTSSTSQQTVQYITDKEAQEKILELTKLNPEELLLLRKTRLDQILNILAPKDKTRIKVKEKLSEKAKSHFKITIEQ